MKARTYRNRAMVQVAVVAAVAVFANLLSLKIFGRADLTSNKAYSVSESTRQVLRGLDDVVNVKVYFSQKLPPYMTTLTREVRDVIDEYRAYAGGNLVVDMKDPADDPATEQRVKALGIPQIQLNVITKDKSEVMPGYLGIAVLYGDKSEVIPVVDDASNLEYDLTSAIVKVTASEQKTIGFLSGHGEPDIYKDMEGARRSLERQYSVAAVVTAGGQEVPPDVNTLVVAGPGWIRAWDRYAIDQFLMRGGRILFMLDRVGITESSLEGSKLKTGLDSLLAHYGADVKADLVVDRSCGTATFSAGFFSFQVAYVLWPAVAKGGFDKVSPITNQLERVVLPWASSIDVEGAHAETVVLARSSQQSWSETRNFNLNPQRNFTSPKEQTLEPRNLAVLMRGSFTSFFKDRPIPTADTAFAEGASKPEPQTTPQTPKIDVSPETQIIVVGNSRFIRDEFLRQYPENQTFFLNAVDWLTLGESLIGIRSRVVSSRPIKEIGERSKATIRFASTLGIPIAVVAFGLAWRYARTGKRRRAAREILGAADGAGDQPSPEGRE
jgi:gliding-associated putative ABC transporter substrate-binding component GldG